FFFFSSRRRPTRFSRDWSSDVCSSDLTRKLYADKLVAQGVLVEGEPEDMVKEYRQLMEDGQRTVEPVLTDYKNKYATDWTPFLNAKWTDHGDTGVPLSELTRIGERITSVPENFTVHPL